MDFLYKNKYEAKYYLLQNNMQLGVGIWIYRHLKEGNENVVKDILKWSNNSHFLVDVVQSWKLETVKKKLQLWCLEIALFNRSLSE